MSSSSFKIINASAGSGKTTSLVYHFLLRLFLESDDIGYRNMLALTFTNKAVNEMKWFDALSAGKQHTDFFANRVTNYSKGHIEWDSAAIF